MPCDHQGMIHISTSSTVGSHATRTDWRDQAEDDHGPDSRDGCKSVFRDGTTEGRCALQGEKQADSRHCPALRSFQAPAVMARHAPGAYSSLTLTAFCNLTPLPIHHNGDREPCAFGLSQTQGSPTISATTPLLHTSDKCCSIAREVLPMSFRNGDKSREHRLRKARQKMRVKTRGLQVKDDAKAQSAATRAPKK